MIYIRSDIVFDSDGGTDAAITISVAAIRVCLDALAAGIIWVDETWQEVAITSDQQALIDSALAEMTNVLNGI